jgi:hypothetical protein
MVVLGPDGADLGRRALPLGIAARVRRDVLRREQVGRDGNESVRCELIGHGANPVRQPEDLMYHEHDRCRRAASGYTTHARMLSPPGTGIIAHSPWRGELPSRCTASPAPAGSAGSCPTAVAAGAAFSS